MKMTLLSGLKSWDQQNYIVISRGFWSIRPLYNEVPLYDRMMTQLQNIVGGLEFKK